MNNKKAYSGKKNESVKKESSEKVVFWIGSIAGIIISLFTIYDRLIEPKSAKLDVNFFESTSKDIYIIRNGDTGAEIPIQLKLENTGGKIAKHVKLYISYDAGIQIETKYGKEIKRTSETPNDVMFQLSMILEDLNPGESFLIPIRVKLDYPREFQTTLNLPGHTVLDTNLLHPLNYSLHCEISSETSKNTNSRLFITIGRLDQLQEQSSKVFWIGYGAKDTVLILVDDDYLKHK